MNTTTAGRYGWALFCPPLAAVIFALTCSALGNLVVGLALIAAVLAGVHHAEVVADRIGEPLGSLILAVAVTIIEVGLIVIFMVDGGAEASTLARDTIFAAVMITLNGIVGLSLVVGAYNHHLAVFNAEGAGSALATVIALAGLTLVVPSFTIGEFEPIFTSSQLAFVVVASPSLYAMFVFTQTVRHRDFFLPVGVLTAVPGRAKPLNGGVRLVLLAAFLFLTVSS